GEQTQRGVRPVYLVVVVLHIAQGIGRFHHAGSGEGHVLFGRDAYIEQHGVGQVPQRVVGVADSGLILVVKGGGEGRPLHVQHLPKVTRILRIEAVAVYFQVHIQQVEAVEEVADPAPAVLVVGPGQHHVFELKRHRRRHQPNHTVGHGHAVVVAGVNI
nr:hypothetical protein [Tanacetum cinerariifolium]